jgi:hypothetical protein
MSPTRRSWATSSLRSAAGSESPRLASARSVAGGIEVAGAGVESGGDGVCVCWGPHPPAHRLRRHVTQFCRLVTGADDFKSLGHAHIAGVTLAHLLAENGGRGGRVLGITPYISGIRETP